MMIGRQGRRGAPVGKAATCFWRARGENWWGEGRKWIRIVKGIQGRSCRHQPGKRGEEVTWPPRGLNPKTHHKKIGLHQLPPRDAPLPPPVTYSIAAGELFIDNGTHFSPNHPFCSHTLNNTMSGPLGNLPGMTYDSLKNRYFPTPKGPLQNDQPAPSLYASTSLPRKGRPEMVLGLLDCQLQRKRQRPDIHESVVSGPGRKLVKGRGRMGVGMGKRSER